MNPKEIYTRLEQELENGELNDLQKQVFMLLKENPAGLSRQDLVGYRLDISREAVNKMLNELRSRRTHIDEQINATLKFYDIPIAYLTDSSEVTQMELIP